MVERERNARGLTDEELRQAITELRARLDVLQEERIRRVIIFEMATGLLPRSKEGKRTRQDKLNALTKENGNAGTST